ncbi:MAG: HrpE/YscL family type III secretion apparatus protein [Parachlamydiaceae bacterium]|nr:HrpE/YscL family type III secretion apparatus protein [Parachlamydiaceae bacterium]
MKKKFFSLIKGDVLEVAPKVKILPAEAFSTLLEASELLKNVQKDAEEFKIQIVEECETLKSQAQQEGFEAGFKSWADAVALLEKEIGKVRTDLEKRVAPVALKVAKKIVGREIELSDKAIVDIVSSSLKSVVQHKKITIYVNKKDLAILDANRAQLKDLFESLESLSLRERADIESGGCVIETEGGIINARLENQWAVLEKAFSGLLKKQSEAQEIGEKNGEI